MRYNTWRILTRPVRFIFNASTVACPVGVKPIICVWSSLQHKWSCHLCTRGLYSGTRVLCPQAEYRFPEIRCMLRMVQLCDKTSYTAQHPTILPHVLPFTPCQPMV
jgi:hypothetical protein